jgi:hypothetical protein
MTTICSNALFLMLHAFSYHSVAGYESNTPGLSLQCSLNDNASISAGVYRNSLRKTTMYSVLGLETDTPLRLGIFAGAATGYEKTVIPVAGLSASFKLLGFKFSLLALPLQEKSHSFIEYRQIVDEHQTVTYRPVVKKINGVALHFMLGKSF